MKQLRKILKDNGSFIFNIKEHPSNGERETYVLELILEMKKQGWLWIEEYCWYKKNLFLESGQIALEIHGNAAFILPNKKNLKCIKRLLKYLLVTGPQNVLNL